MSWTRGLVRAAIGELTPEIAALSDTLDNKVELRNFWLSDSGKMIAKKLQDDAMICLKALQNFETMSFDEIKGHLSKYRADMITLSTMRDSDNIDEIQEMLDNAVKSRAEQLRR